MSKTNSTNSTKLLELKERAKVLAFPVTVKPLGKNNVWTLELNYTEMFRALGIKPRNSNERYAEVDKFTKKYFPEVYKASHFIDKGRGKARYSFVLDRLGE